MNPLHGVESNELLALDISIHISNTFLRGIHYMELKVRARVTGFKLDARNPLHGVESQNHRIGLSGIHRGPRNPLHGVESHESLREV